MNKLKTTSRLLMNEEPIVVNPTSATVLGLPEAVIVQQIHYWLEINRKAKINFIDGRTWTYNTYTQWQEENFKFISVSTLKRIFKKLFDDGILLKGNYNKYKYDRTLWVTIDYQKLDDMLSDYENKNVAENTEIKENVEISTECQNDTMSDCNIVSNWYYAKCQNDTMESVNLIPPIPEITTEISTETSLCSSTHSVVVDTNKELIENNTNLTLDSKNKRDKVAKWDKERLIKAIEIYNKQEGIYFTLLEKIYKDDRNFNKPNKKPATPKSNNKNMFAKPLKEDDSLSLEEKIMRNREKRESRLREDVVEVVEVKEAKESIAETNTHGYMDDVLANIIRMKEQENNNK